MGRRLIVLFWGSAAAAVFFLGSTWTGARRLGSGPHALANAVVLGIAIAGLAVTALVAGRIAFVIGRAQRRARALRGHSPAVSSRPRGRVKERREVGAATIKVMDDERKVCSSKEVSSR